MPRAFPPDVDPLVLESAIQRLLAVVHASRKRQGQLQHALQSRIVIEQAKGILGERYGLNMDDAFSRLRSTARSSRRSLHQVAAEVVAG